MQHKANNNNNNNNKDNNDKEKNWQRLIPSLLRSSLTQTNGPRRSGEGPGPTVPADTHICGGVQLDRVWPCEKKKSVRARMMQWSSER